MAVTVYPCVVILLFEIFNILTSFRLMENGPPEGNFEVQYYSGEKFTYSASKGTWSSNVPGVPDPAHHPVYRYFLLLKILMKFNLFVAI